jgi:transposase-like protein
MMAERGISLAHMATCAEANAVFRNRKAAEPLHAPGWAVKKVTSRSKAVGPVGPVFYRALDKEGRNVHFLLRAKRDVAAAKAFSGERSGARAANA